MRSLTPTGLLIATLEQDKSPGQLSKLAVDPESGVIYAALERNSVEEGSEVEVDLIKFEFEKETGWAATVSERSEVARLSSHAVPC